MPVVVAIAIRYIIMAAVQLGIWSLIEKYGIGLLNRAIVAVAVAFGVSKETANDIVANKVLLAFESVGIFALTLRTKLPIKVAELLGFTSKGYVLRKVGGAAAAKAEQFAISATSKATTTSVEAGIIAEAVSATRGLTLSKVNTVISLILKIVAMPVGIFYAFAQYVDYAAWQNPYQKTMEGLLSKIGINPDTPMPKANVVSADIWKRIYSTIEQDVPLGISFPYSDKDTPYSRKALADVVDEVAANIAKSGGSASYKNVLGAVLPLLQYNGKERRVPDFTLIDGSPIGGSSSSSGGSGTTTTPKVFTGIVSQGVVSQGLTFTPRPDDLIESVTELREAAANNLAPFLRSLFGKIVYEVKVVPSVITKDGFKQSGTTQRIQYGTYNNGQPKYKSVTNKFATLNIYALTEKSVRAKLATIVLGPTDASKLVVGVNDLRTLESELGDIVTTTDLNEIESVDRSQNTNESSGGDSSLGSTQAEESPQPTRVIISRNFVFATNPYDFFEKAGYGEWNPERARRVAKAVSFPGLNGKDFDPTGINLEKLWTYIKSLEPEFVVNKLQSAEDALFNIPPSSAPVTVPVVTPAKATAVKTVSNASTLFEWYQAQGRALPGVSARALEYQRLGLGQASYYTGTSEQNTKLLAALKSGTNVPTSQSRTYESTIQNNALRVL